MGRERERLCADRFEEHLASVGIAGLLWEDGDEPPDFYLTVGGVRFAVEATDIEESIQTILEDGTVGERRFHETHRSLINTVEQEAIERGVLRGLYIATFYQPATAQSFSKVRDQVREFVLDYVQSTQSRTSSEEQWLRVAGRRFLSIGKYPGETGIEGCFVGGTWEESEEVFETLEAQLRHAVQRKRVKLLAKGIVLPGVLLLYRTYAFGSAQMHAAAAQRIAELPYFHTVFLVQDPGHGPGVVLHTRQPAWAPPPRDDLKRQTR